MDYSGLAVEDNRSTTFAEALAALEKCIRACYAEQGIELD
jgi:hypothetical protein